MASNQKTTRNTISRAPKSKPGLRLFILILFLLSVSCQYSALFDEGESTPSGSVLFQDDFSDVTSGWIQDYSANGSTDYQDSGYRITLTSPNWLMWSIPKLQFNDVRIEVDATKVSGPDNNSHGIICRYIDEGHFYSFAISSDGYYGIAKFIAGEGALIDMQTMQYSQAIHQGEGTNHLSVECVGDSLSLSVNGEELVRVIDGDYRSGEVGLIASTYDEPGTDILFDNFSVLKP